MVAKSQLEQQFLNWFREGGWDSLLNTPNHNSASPRLRVSRPKIHR